MYHRLLTRVLDTPLLISEHKLGIISERVLIPLLIGAPVPKTLAEGDNPARSVETSAIGKTAIIPVMDTLFAKNGAGLSGGTTYENISNQIRTAIANKVTDIGFYIDSPGGEGFGLFSLMHEIRSLPEKGIRTFSFTDGMMTSAAYGIASATQKIYAAENSLVGSIGAVLTHVDKTEADNQQGIKYTILRSKPEKALVSSHEVLTEEVRSRLETYLARTDAMFNNEIAKGRAALSLDEIVNMRGSEFLATEALSLKLIDEIVPNLDTAFSSHQSFSQQSGNVKMNEDELLTQLASAKTEVTALQASLQQSVKMAVAEEKARILTIIGNGQKLNLSNDLILRHIDKGYSVEASLDIMTEIREAKEAETAIESSTGAHQTAADDMGSDKIDLKTAYKKAVGKK